MHKTPANLPGFFVLAAYLAYFLRMRLIAQRYAALRHGKVIDRGG